MQVVKSAQVNEKEVQAIQVLPAHQKALITALIDSKILGLENNSAVNSMYEILKRSEISSGLTKVDNKDLVALAISAYDLVKENFKNITMSEFSLACKNGVIGNYGEWFGMCLKSVNQWIKGYLNNEARTQAIKDWNAKICKEETSDKPIQAKIEFSKESAKRAFENFKLKSEMPLAPAAYYDLINEWIGEDYNGNKTLVTDSEARKKILEDVKIRFEKLCLGQKFKSENNGNHSEAEKLINLVMDPKGNKTLERMTKEAFLKHFFNSLIYGDKTLEI